jgi:hypothetical protein
MVVLEFMRRASVDRHVVKTVRRALKRNAGVDYAERRTRALSGRNLDDDDDAAAPAEETVIMRAVRVARETAAAAAAAVHNGGRK